MYILCIYGTTRGLDGRMGRDGMPWHGMEWDGTLYVLQVEPPLFKDAESPD